MNSNAMMFKQAPTQVTTQFPIAAIYYVVPHSKPQSKCPLVLVGSTQSERVKFSSCLARENDFLNDHPGSDQLKSLTRLEFRHTSLILIFDRVVETLHEFQNQYPDLLHQAQLFSLEYEESNKKNVCAIPMLDWSDRKNMNQNSVTFPLSNACAITQLLLHELKRAICDFSTECGSNLTTHNWKKTPIRLNEQRENGEMNVRKPACSF